MRQCCKCKEVYDDVENNFHRDSYCTGGYSRRCKTCSHQYYYENREHYKEIQKHINRKRLYNLSEIEYDNMRINQNNSCAICKQEFTNENVPYIDHSHKTKNTRGLLCIKCNSALGFFDDNKQFLKNAIEYLDKYER